MAKQEVLQLSILSHQANQLPQGASNACPGLFKALANAPNADTAAVISQNLIRHGCSKGTPTHGAPPRDIKKPIALKGKLATSWGKIKAKY